MILKYILFTAIPIFKILCWALWQLKWHLKEVHSLTPTPTNSQEEIICDSNYSEWSVWGKKTHKLILQKVSLNGIDSNMQHLIVSRHRWKGFSKISWTDWLHQCNHLCEKAKWKWLHPSNDLRALTVDLLATFGYWWYHTLEFKMTRLVVSSLLCMCRARKTSTWLVLRWKTFQSVCLFLLSRVLLHFLIQGFD